MERKLIDEIIALENSLREHIGQERSKAAQWLEGEKRRLDAFVRAEEECCSREVARATNAARREAESQREMVISEAETLAGRIRAISDEELRAIVSRHAGRVLP